MLIADWAKIIVIKYIPAWHKNIKKEPKIYFL